MGILNLDRRSGLILAGALLVGPCLGGALYRTAAVREERELAERLRTDLDASASALEARLSRVVETVTGAAALFEAARELGREEFAGYATRMLARLPAVRALEWAPRVGDAERARHEEWARAELGASYHITEATREGRLAPAGARPERIPVGFVVPLAGNESAVGFDLASESLRARALQRAVESGEAALSDPVRLVQSERDEWSVLLVVPVFAAPAAREGNGREARGFAVGVVRIADLVAAALPEEVAAAGGSAALELTDDDVAGERVVLWSSAAGHAGSARAGAPLRRELEVGGQRWALTARLTDMALSEGRSSSPVLLGTASFAGWQLLVGLTVVLTRRGRDRRLRRSSEGKRARELTQRLASAVEQTADSVLITDRAGVIEYVNPAFERTTGYSRAEAVGATPRLLRSAQQEPDFYRELWATILSGEPFEGTLVNRRKSGGAFVAEQTITPMRDSQSGEISHFVSVLRDLTERTRFRAQETELRLAAAVQRRLYPDPLPRVAGFDIAAAMVPALTTCGDYFDLIELPDGRLAVVVADACGHGVGPALIMAETRAILRSLTAVRRDLEELVGELNRLLLADLEEHLYVTMVLGLLDPATGVLSWANMGHPAGYVLDAAGAEKSRLGSTCLPLGLFPQLGSRPGRTTTLAPGDLVVLLTDGVTESSSPDGRELGPAAVLDVVRGCRHEPAARIVEAVLGAARAHGDGQGQRDDVTVVAIRRDA